MRNCKIAELLSRAILAVIFFALPLIGTAQEYAIGADLSFLKSAEDQGFVFRENGQPAEGLKLFKDHGYQWIRLRLFHTPTRLPNNLEYTIALAKKAKEMGYKFLLNYHYSDTWADPGKQYTPAAWEKMSHKELVEAVFGYTRSTMIAFRDAGAMPDMVQPGNEIINGMMWPGGKLPENWDNFADLLKAGIRGVYASVPAGAPMPRIMIHIDQGGNIEKTKYFFEKIKYYSIEYDVIGQSYYPWWHGTLLDLRANLIFMAETYRKPIIMVEVAYCSTPAEYKERNAPFPETPEGQKEFLEEVNRIVLATPGNLGAGIFWWEPATYGGRSARDFFDEAGNVLPVITVFDKFTRH